MSLYLSRVVLDPRRRQVQQALADCQMLHRAVMAAFPDLETDEARASLGVLYRLEHHPRTGEVTLLVQSARPPDWSAERVVPLLLSDADPPGVKPVDRLYAGLRRGMRLRFRLRANPTKRLRSAPNQDGARPLGKRVDVRGEVAQLAWLARKGGDHGFALGRVRARPDAVLANVRAAPEQRQTGRQPASGEEGSRRLTFGAVLFEGELVVTDGDALRRAVAEGIGSGKAYGFGLLSLAPLGGATEEG